MSVVDELEEHEPGLLRLLRFLRDQGWPDDEIVDYLDRKAARPPRPPRFPLGGSAGKTGLSLRERRRIDSALAELSAGGREEIPGVPAATPANVRAERDRRRAAREPYGYKALAKVFVVSPTTIRRRLSDTK